MTEDEMKRSAIIFKLSLIALIAALTASAQDREIVRKADEYLGAQVKLGRFSGSVLVARKGEVLYKKSFGMANIELNAPNTPQTKFRIGSITEQFTAMAVLILEEQKKLNTSDSAGKYLPGYPNGDKITIHHLLTHTSGIPSFTEFPEYAKAKFLPSPVAKTIELFKAEPLEFQPGERFKYSNSGYVLLTAIIEKASGMTYEQFIQERIFGPLGMQDSGYDHNSTVLKNRALGYSQSDGRLVNAPYIDMSVPSGAGALYSTVEDLYLWDRALYTEKLVGKSSLEKIFSPFKEDYGYGWVIKPVEGRKRIWHNGGIEGFLAEISRFPDSEVCIIILSNFDFAPTGRIRNDLAAIVFGDAYELPGNR
jgi:CubicO group peptidase (beta-lactamase class C family)